MSKNANTNPNENKLLTQFGSNQNKGIIWNLLIENGVFNGIPEHKAALIKNDFDTKINIISGQINPGDEIIALNKRVITEMINEVKTHVTDMNMTNMTNVTNMTNMTTTTTAPQPIYRAAELTEQRQNIFQKELASKQTEFADLLHSPVPPKVEFADIKDTPIGSEMDKMLAETIARRERQLNIVLETQDKTAANKWLNNSEDAAAKNTNSTNNIVQLKIGEKIKLNQTEVLKPSPVIINNNNNTNNKKVNFSDNTNTNTSADNDDFMKFLKPALTEPGIAEMLREILAKQNQILALLQK